MALKEFALIQQYFSSQSNDAAGVVLGIGDDAALVAPRPDHLSVVTVDTLVAGVHFPENAPPDSIGHKALAVNLSDLAAMGAEPAWFTLALTLPDIDDEWLHAFSKGLFALARRFNIALIGGDTTRGPLSITLQAMGHIPKHQALRRSGAQLGDRIFVSGQLGAAAWGLAQWRAGVPYDQWRGDSFQRLCLPEPRVALGLALRGCVNSAIDVSDGLLADIGHIAQRSHVGARIGWDDLPSSPLLREQPTEDVETWLNAGDDYELCFTCAPENVDRVLQRAESVSLAVTDIGEIVSEPGVARYDAEGQRLSSVEGYRHFD